MMWLMRVVKLIEMMSELVSVRVSVWWWVGLGEMS